MIPCRSAHIFISNNRRFVGKQATSKFLNYFLTYFSQHFGAESTSKSMTISPRDVSSKTLIAYEACPVEFWVSTTITARFTRPLGYIARPRGRTRISKPRIQDKNRPKILWEKD